MSTADERLPYVDEHSIAIAANPKPTWDALLRVIERSFSSARTARGARMLGCADVAEAGPRPLSAGSAFPGFHVFTVEPPRELALLGRHRLSDYALIFRLEPSDGGTRLRAETRAEFPGLRGSVYRAAVIGTGAHVLVTRRLLEAVKRAAERGASSGLCDSCLHQKLVPNTRGSVFSLCLRSRTDPSFPRYPRVPVLRCAGYEQGPVPLTAGGGDEPAPS